MTGIERLREWADGYAELGKDHTTVDVVPSGMAMLLSSIADQIELERDEERSRWDDELCDAQMDKTCVMAVYLEMNRHVSGVEGMEDSPVARWARELREALGGDVRDPAADVSVSAYDLLPQEDRDAIAWVRKHGGLDAVKRRWECLSYYADPVPRSCMEKRLARLQRQIDESHAALRRRRETISELNHRACDLTRENAKRGETIRKLSDRAAKQSDEIRVMRDVIAETCARLGVEGTGSTVDDAQVIWREISRRLMPEGMEWPRFEDGEPVRIGDEFMGNDGKTYTVKQVQLMGCYFSLYDFCDQKPQLNADYGERVERPAPKVLDADGVEIRVGDTVYDVEDGCEIVVTKVTSDAVFVAFEDVEADKYDASQLTHRAPVLAADGRPLEVGQTVYAKNYDYVKCTVLAIEWVVDGYLVEVENEGGHKFRQTPDEFTHQRPALDADGNRIEPAMDVWWICEGDERGVHAERLRVETIGLDGLVECSPYNGGTWVSLEPSELYVNKPVPASDGRPLREGETVYHIADGKEYTVEKLFEDGAMVTHDGITGGRCRAEYLTHQRPVLDADGVPIHEGETVWDTKGNGPYIIKKIENDRFIRIEGSDLNYFGYEFTHERPDSWERLEEDAGCTATKYNERRGTIFTTKQQVARDLVRRCRALAERGE